MLVDGGIGGQPSAGAWIAGCAEGVAPVVGALALDVGDSGGVAVATAVVAPLV
jgi:hypothetical protein